MDELVNAFKSFVARNYADSISKAIRNNESFFIDFKEMDLQEQHLADSLLNSPNETIEAFKMAYNELEFSLEPRFVNLPENNIVKIKDIRTKNLNKLIQIEGLVRQASEVRPASASIEFECPACAQRIIELQTSNHIIEPKRCTNCGRMGKFTVINNQLIDRQRVVIEESPEKMDGGEQPQRIDIILNKDLVDPTIIKKICPGSKIEITGVLQEVPIYLRSGGKSNQFDLVIQANAIKPIEYEFTDIEIDIEDETKIKEFARDPKVYDKLISSMAPNIYGNDEVKEAIVTQLFGGVRKIRHDRTTVRGDIHVLLVGDPGVSKTQLLKYVAGIAPKARYVSGKGSSAAGMTASVVKDEFIRGWSLEAGALVLANKGIALIDELDKMSVEDRSAMHEALESQTVTISKANIQATLNSQTSVLAAANPKFGRFDPYAPIAEQINIPPTLLNRFDLIFPMRDLPDKDRDSKIATHMLEAAQEPGKKRGLIESEFLRKYISYAKKINPVITPAAAAVLKEFYVSLRNKKSMGEDEVRAIPISPRQLEALIRISEGVARVRLSDKVMKKDAERAIKMLHFSLSKIGIDPETGEIDIDRIVSGISAKQRSNIMQIKELINELSNKYGNAIPSDELINEAVNQGIPADKAEELIDKMKREGEIFEPKHGIIRKLPR
ncbi:MAG: minichromosome maintenance protein MCM [Candidatus Nanoarchaeia archaeon]|jgi:replicative DNA helicase Mcm